MDNRAIGVFDSGLGGLTTVRELRKLLPDERIVYFGDTGRVPYGNRSRETIRKYAMQDIRFLKRHEVKLVIAACGTVSSALTPELSAEAGRALLGGRRPRRAGGLRRHRQRPHRRDRHHRDGAFGRLWARHPHDQPRRAHLRQRLPPLRAAGGKRLYPAGQRDHREGRGNLPQAHDRRAGRHPHPRAAPTTRSSTISSTGRSAPASPSSTPASRSRAGRRAISPGRTCSPGREAAAPNFM